jgi:hypothetical protein
VVIASTPDELGKFVAEEKMKFAKFVKDHNIKAD